MLQLQGLSRIKLYLEDTDAAGMDRLNELVEGLGLSMTVCALPEVDYEESWKAITSAAAKLTGIGDRVGSLEVGKDGDVVIWTADPMTVLAAQSACTIVDGKVVYQA